MPNSLLSLSCNNKFLYDSTILLLREYESYSYDMDCLKHITLVYGYLVENPLMSFDLMLITLFLLF
jgi:hypothetical protein